MRKTALFLMIFAFILSSSGLVYAQLADSPWPMPFHDPQHTVTSQYVGPQTNDTRLFFPLDGVINYGAIIDGEGTIYIGVGPSGTWTTNIYAITKNGSLKWNTTIGRDPNTNAAPSAIASDGTIYVKRTINCCPPASGYSLYALYPNGTIKWFFDQSKFINSTYFSNATYWRSESLAVGDINIDQDGSVYFTVAKGSSTYLISNYTLIEYTEYTITYYLFSINPDGTFRWMYKFPTNTSYDTLSISPIAIGYDGNIYMTPMDRNVNRNNLVVFAPNGSIILWGESMAYAFNSYPSIGEDGTIYVNGIELYALAPNGTILWERDIVGSYATQNTPIITNDSVIVMASLPNYQGAIQAFDFNGNSKWIFYFEKDTGSRQPIADRDGNIYFEAMYTTYALNSNGTLKWVYNRSFISYAIGLDNTLYALDWYGLYVFGPAVGLIDSDNDGIQDSEDNCPSFYNPSQTDADNDEIGDACDNCWYTTNSNQLDSNSNCPSPPYLGDPQCGNACEVVEESCSDGIKNQDETDIDCGGSCYPCTEKILGIDVSNNQGNISWTQVYNSGKRFAFVKATQRTDYTDPKFETNMENANATDILVGAYHFACPERNDVLYCFQAYNATEEAQHFVNEARNYIKRGYLRPVLDLEVGAGLSKVVLSEWVDEFMNAVKTETGVEPILYLSSNYATNELERYILDKYDLWIAHWTYNYNNLPGTLIWGELDFLQYADFWQYSDNGSVSGIIGYADLDIFNGNLSELYNFLINQPPIADAGMGSQFVSSGDLVLFNASNSTDLDGAIVSYQWNFGDNETAAGPVVIHRFRGRGDGLKTYSVTLTVQDDKGATDTDTARVVVEPLTKSVNVSLGLGGLVFSEAVMKTTYNWINETNGEDVYIVSEIYADSIAVVGMQQVSITRDTYQLWSDVLLTPGARYEIYTYPFTPISVFGTEPTITSLTFPEGTFEGIEVRASDKMNLLVFGATGIKKLFGDDVSTAFYPTAPVEYPLDPYKYMPVGEALLTALNSPGELRIYDSQGRVTGLVNGEAREEIPNSAYFNETIIILSPSDSYTYDVSGTGDDVYGLTVVSIEDGNETNFTATDIPIITNSLHQYTIDWEVLSQGGDGVTLQVDFDRDGVFEKTVTADGDLTQDEYLDTDGDGVLDIVDNCPLENATGFDADSNGCIDSFSGLRDLINALDPSIMPYNLKTFLISIVNSAEEESLKGNINTSVYLLNHKFKYYVEKHRSWGIISDNVANLLIDYVDNIIIRLHY